MKMSLIVLAALALSMAMRHRSAALRHWILAAGVTCGAAMPILGAVVPPWTMPFAAPASFSTFSPYEETAVPTAAPAAAADASRSRPAPATTTRPPAAVPLAVPTAITLLTWLWMAGIVASLAVLAIGVLRLTWVAARARHVSQGRWPELTAELSRQYQLQRPVTILQSDHPSLLVTWGLAHPKIILPAAAWTWSDERARVVVAHELAHIHRRDWVVQLTAELLRAFYWFNPLLWIACRRLRLESEHACDDEVMKRGVEGTDYATHLIDLARALNHRTHIWFPAPAMARPSSLERRVKAMLNNHVDRTSISRRARGAIVGLLLVVASVVAGAQSKFVSFTGAIADEQGRRVPGVKVLLVNAPRQARYEVKTNDEGRFEFVGLPADDYAVEVEGIGFRTIKETLKIGTQDLQRDFILQLGTLQETVTVGFNPSQPDSAGDVPKVGTSLIVQKKECVAASEGGRIVPPRKIRDASPYYPSALRGTWLEGVVLMEARIGVDGHVADVRVLNDAQSDLAYSAVSAVREWRFTETLLNCTPVEVTMTVTVNFERKGA